MNHIAIINGLTGEQQQEVRRLGDSNIVGKASPNVRYHRARNQGKSHEEAMKYAYTTPKGAKRRKAVTPKIVEVWWTDNGDGTFTIAPEWSGADRRTGTGYQLKSGTHDKLGDRLVAAMWDGVIFTNPKVRTDVNGKSYVDSDSRVSARTLNADLRRLGY